MLCISCNVRVARAKGLCHNCYQKAAYHRKRNQSPPNEWSYRFESCIKCGTTDFKHVADGLCMFCYHKSYVWQRRLKYQYNMTIEQYEELFNSQNGVCAICKLPETRKSKSGSLTLLSIDHDHLTNKIRGLLCFKCNTGLGLFNDGDLLEIAINYVNLSKEGDRK